MLDNCSFRIEEVDTFSFDQIIDTLGVFAPSSGNVRKAKWYNMQILYYPSQQRVILRNSLHKLYNLLQTGVDTNANDFGLSELNHLTKILGIYFDKGPEEFILTSKLEFGLNINTDEVKPFDIGNRWLSCKCKEFFVINPSKGKPLQKTCFFSDYRIKGYDKGQLAGVKDRHIFRMEIVVHKLRKMREIAKVKKLTLKELNDPEVWVNFYQYLMATYDSISKAPMLMTPVPLEDLFLTFAYMNPLLANDVKRTMKPDNYNKWRAKAKKVYDRHNHDSSNFHHIVRRKLEAKFIEVYNG